MTRLFKIFVAGRRQPLKVFAESEEAAVTQLFDREESYDVEINRVEVVQ